MSHPSVSGYDDRRDLVQVLHPRIAYGEKYPCFYYRQYYLTAFEPAFFTEADIALGTCVCTGTALEAVPGESVYVKGCRAAAPACAAAFDAVFAVFIHDGNRYHRHHCEHCTHRTEELAEKSRHYAHADDDSSQYTGRRCMSRKRKASGCERGEQLPRVCHAHLCIPAEKAENKYRCQHCIFDILQFMQNVVGHPEDLAPNLLLQEG